MPVNLPLSRLGAEILDTAILYPDLMLGKSGINLAGTAARM
jgi:hypothetical protein